MPYVFGIDLIFIDANVSIKTLGMPLDKKGLIFESELGYNPIIRANPEEF